MEEEKKNREKIIGKEKDETKIVDNENRVIDIDMLLSEKRNDSTVQGINYLLGLNTRCVDREFITKRFEERAGNVLDESIALEILKTVLEDAIIEINEKDEYIYINTTTGKVDAERSQAKMKEYGENHTVSNTLQDNVNRFFEKETLGKDDKKEENKTPFAITKEFITRKNAEVDKFFFDNKQREEIIKQINETVVEQQYIGENLFEQYKKIIEQLAEFKTKYIDDEFAKEEVDLLEYDARLREAMNTPRFEEILNERNEFLKKHTDLEELINPETGLIYDDSYNNYKNDLQRDNDNLVKAGVIKHISCISKMGFENITEEQRQHAVMDIVAGLNFEETKEEVSKFLEKLVPGYKHSEDINNKENRIAIEKAMKYTDNLQLQKEGFERLLKASYKTVLEKTNHEDIIKEDVRNVTDAEVEEYMALNSQEIDVEQIIIEKTGTEEDKYFIGSKLQFSKEDNEAFQYIYKKSTIGTWIDTKDEAIEKRFLCLQNSKEELENSNSDLAKQRLEKINSEIEKFKKDYPGLDYNSMLDSNGKLNSSKKRAIRAYTEFRAISKLTKEIIADEEKVNSFEDYNGLSNKDKKAYLLNTIAILNSKDINYGQANSEKIKDNLKKLGNRRLEILNNKETQFINIDDDNIKVNTKAILKEFNKLSSHKFKTYEEILEYCELNKLEYVNEKMQLCMELDETGFEKIGKSRISDKERLERIEKSKLISWNKRQVFGNIDNMILGNIDEKTMDSLVLSDELKDQIRQLDEDILSEDAVMMEFQRLQGMIDESHGINQKQFIKQRDELIRNNPKKYNDFLNAADNPKVYDERLYNYNNAIIAKNVLLTIGTINKLDYDDIKTLVDNPQERNKVLLTLLSSFEGALEGQQAEVLKAIQKICPNMKLLKLKGAGASNLERVLPLLGKTLGMDEYSDDKMMKLVYQSKSIMLENENNRRLATHDIRDMNQALDITEMYSNIDVNEISENREKRYFNNSKFEYSGEDMVNFEELYYKTISRSWIESKEVAEKYRYIYWLKLEKVVNSNPNITEEGRQRFNEKLEELEKSNPSLRKENFLESNGEVKKEFEDEYTEYEDMKFMGDLLGDYVLDENVVESSEDFEKLSRGEQFKYLLNSYLGFVEKRDEVGTINKMAMRRLEIISTPEKQFITIDENGNFTIDEKLFCEEYNRVTKRDFKNFDDLNRMYKDYKSAHVRARLSAYCRNTKPEDFVKIDSEDDRARAIQIEKIKSKNYLKRSLNIIGKTDLKKRQVKNKKIKTETQETSIEKSINLEEKASENIYSKPQNYELVDNQLETSEIKVEKIAEEKVSDIPQESAPTLIDKVKSVFSNFGKSPNEDIEQENETLENEDKPNELLPVERKKGFFNIIADKFKNLFVKESKEDKTEKVEQHEGTGLSSFEAQLRVGTENVNIAEAVRKTQENSNSIRQANSEKISQEQSDVVFE